MAESHYMTQEGLEKIKKDLEDALAQRPVISAQIAEAREKGDLSENAEYDSAKEAQGLLEMKIAKLQNLIANARILDESKLDTSKILIYSIVTIKNLKSGQQFVYTIVPESEANFREGKISVSSPIAKGLLGKKVGDVAEVTAPVGILNFEIIKISR